MTEPELQNSVTQTPEPQAPLTVPRRTTPTWEVELLISGALTIGLFQLPPMLEGWFAQSISMAPSDRIPIVIYGYLYSKLVLFALIGTFVLHIAARAHWVALVGVNTVFPGGPRWENLSGGPIGRRVARQIAGNVDDAIERADNRSTLIFSYGILTAQFSLGILIVSLVTVIVSGLLTPIVDPRWSLMGAALLLTLPALVFGSIDRFFGARFREGSWATRQMERGLHLVARLGMVRFAQPLLPMLVTNIGGRRGGWMLAAVMTLVMAVTVYDTFAHLKAFNWMRGDALPELTRGSGVNPVHYGALRNDDQSRYSNAPYIPDEVIEGPFLRLVLPYSAERHDRALSQQCRAELDAIGTFDDAPTARDEGAVQAASVQRSAAESALMQCFSRLFDLRLDNAAIPGVRLERFRDPFSGHDAGLAMIDVRALAPGRHELQINRLPKASNSLRMQSDSLEPPDRIVFWH